ncbi:MAG: hypothetical protein E4G99_02245 [Anaerolineales bacterium]|nr:MAG: hypothetical protein E4G99_02245 [Anaerolineales bacterium]
MRQRRRNESGQSYIIMALLMVGLLSFSALAIDGGILLHEHRRSQNAADASAMAAAYAKIRSQPLGIAALNNATANEYPTTAQACTPAGPDCILGIGTQVIIQVTNPPRSGQYAGDPDYIHVVIDSEVNSNFAHLIFGGPLSNRAEATSRVWPPENYAFGNAIHATTEHDCKGIWFSGTGDTLITGGNVFSNSDAASVSCQSGVQGGGGAIAVKHPYNINVVGSFDLGGSGTVSPSPHENVSHDELRRMIIPDCTHLPDLGSMKINGAGVTLIQPGHYSEITINNPGAIVNMDPGMYCVDGHKGFTGTGGTVNGTGVMIVMEDGPFDLGGGTVVNLAAETSADSLLDARGYDWKGMLLFVNPNNTDGITINGDTGTNYTGTIFAPNSLITLNGNGTTMGVSAQMIGNQIKVTGTADINITYAEGQNYYLPHAIDLVR